MTTPINPDSPTAVDPSEVRKAVIESVLFLPLIILHGLYMWHLHTTYINYEWLVMALIQVFTGVYVIRWQGECDRIGGGK